MLILKVLQLRVKSKKRETNESYTDKYQDCIACSYGYNLVCDDERLSKFKKDKGLRKIWRKAQFISLLVIWLMQFRLKKIMRKHFKRELVMSKEDEEKRLRKTHDTCVGIIIKIC